LNLSPQIRYRSDFKFTSQMIFASYRVYAVFRRDIDVL